MKFVKLNGWVENNSDFISIGIENGDNKNCIGDQVWISKDGTEMEICAHSDSKDLEEIMKKFEGNSSKAFRGALLRMGVKI
jgi:acylphosphatase